MISKIWRYFDRKRRGIVVWTPSNVYPTAILGDDVSVGKFSEIGPGVKIGDRTRIGMGVFIPEGVIIAEDCFIGPGVIFTHELWSEKHKWPVTIVGPKVGIGANATIKEGLNIGQGSIIGMGAVVVDDVPEYAVVAGCPAKILKRGN